jgi:hypothetical protein
LFVFVASLRLWVARPTGCSPLRRLNHSLSMSV